MRARAAFGAMVVLVSARALADDASCIDASEKSLALRKDGKLHAALEQLAACADPACPSEVKDECTRRIAAIDAVMPSIIFAAKDPLGADLEAVDVSMDGGVLAHSLDGRPISVDPGEHTFRLEVKGQPPVERKLVVREGDKERRESVVIGTLPPPPPPPPKPPSFWNAPKIAAVGLGAVGVLGIGLGAWFGAFAISSQNQERNDCSLASCHKYLQAQTDYDTASEDATASTIAFIAGGVLAAAGVVLWLVAPRVHVTPTTNGHGVGVVIEGAFF